MQSLSLMAKITFRLPLNYGMRVTPRVSRKTKATTTAHVVALQPMNPHTTRHPKAFFSSGIRVINSQSSSTAASNTPPANGNASEVTTITAAPDFHKAA